VRGRGGGDVRWGRGKWEGWERGVAKREERD